VNLDEKFFYLQEDCHLLKVEEEVYSTLFKIELELKLYILIDFGNVVKVNKPVEFCTCKHMNDMLKKL
jgi:hypothetical protein